MASKRECSLKGWNYQSRRYKVSSVAFWKSAHGIVSFLSRFLEFFFMFDLISHSRKWCDDITYLTWLLGLNETVYLGVWMISTICNMMVISSKNTLLAVFDSSNSGSSRSWLSLSARDCLHFCSRHCGGYRAYRVQSNEVPILKEITVTQKR